MASTTLRSFVWNLFEEDADDKTYAKCLHCTSRIKRGKDKRCFSTSPLMKHAETHHREVFMKEKEAAEAAAKQKDAESKQPPPKKQKMDSLQTAHLSQMRLQESFATLKVWDKNDSRAEAINKKVIAMIALDNQPFTIVEDKGFVDLLAHLQPKYCLPSRRYFSETMLPQTFDEYKAKAFAVIEPAESFAFTSDIWTSSASNESFVSLSAHWIDADFTRRSLVLNAKHFPQSHTGANICQMFENMYEDWKIESARRHCLVRDGASNMALGSNLVGISSIHCFIHRLQLVTHDAILSQRAVKDVLAKIRRIVTHFNHSSLACTELKNLQKQDGSQPLLPVQDVSTRWNSTYLMCERAYKLKRPLQLYLAEHDELPKVAANDWLLLERLLLILKPFFELTKQLSTENASISRIIPDVQMLDAFLGTAGNDRGVQTTKQELQNALQARFLKNDDCIFQQKPIVIATALDPRFKLVFIPATMRMSVKTLLLEELHNLLQQSEQYNHNTEPASQTSDENSSTTQEESRATEEEDIWSSLYNSFTQAAQQEQQTPAEDSTVQTLTREMDDYLQLPLLDRNSSELDWWKHHTGQFPHLCVLAKKFLATPASSVYSERLFSEYGNIFEEKRSRLLPKSGEKLLFLHHNMKLLDKY